MGARVGDGIAGATNVEEGEPLVPGTRQLGLSGLQSSAFATLTYAAMRSSLESLWVRCLGPAEARPHAPVPHLVGEPETTGARKWVHCHAASYLRGIAYGTR